ncbi:hypothetical protein TURU_013378 [Turdus rufiventris]|nr:hypothetical protein TURU_013378 [Turdus rufiventris]
MQTVFQQGGQEEKEQKESDDSSSLSTIPSPTAVKNEKVALPISKADREAWGMFDDELSPYTEESLPQPLQPTIPPAEVPTASPMEADRASILLPDDSGCNLEGHAKLMTQLLEEMKSLDAGSKKSDIKKAYKKAHDAILSGLNNIATQLDEREELNERKGSDPAVLQDRRLWVLERMRAREWTFAEAENYLQSKYGPSAAISEEEKILFGGNQDSEKEAGDRMISSLFKALQKPEQKKNEETLPPRDPSYDNHKCWKRFIEKATLTGDFTLESAAIPVVRDAQGDRWEALDWKTITKLQKTVMQYGIENKLVRNQVTAIFKYTLLTPSDTKSIMEFILGPTSYMLRLNKWQAKLEETMLKISNYLRATR